jgi:hypothetical protein
VVGDLQKRRAVLCAAFDAQIAAGKPIPMALAREVRQTDELLIKSLILLEARGKNENPKLDEFIRAFDAIIDANREPGEPPRSSDGHVIPRGTKADHGPDRSDSGGTGYVEEEDTGALVGSLDSERRDAENAEGIPGEAEQPGDDGVHGKWPENAVAALHARENSIVANAKPRLTPQEWLIREQQAMDDEDD